MASNLNEILDSFVEAVGRLGGSLGISRVASQLYALLYLKDEPLSLNEMVDYLKVSKGNVSVNIRELERWGAVRKIWKKGSRRDFYQAEEDVARIIITRLREGMNKRLSPIGELLKEAEGSLSGDLSKQEKVYRRKIKQAKKIYETIEQGLQLLSQENIKFLLAK